MTPRRTDPFPRPFPFAAVLALASIAAACSARADSTAVDSAAVLALPAPVRVLDEFIVRTGLGDVGSSRTVRVLSASALARLPVDALAEAVALQAGVVAQGGELHVRGGRAGELAVVVSGVPLAEPLRDRPFALPLLSITRAELVSGGLGGRDGGTLAGVLDVETVAPPARAQGAFAWQSTAGTIPRYDRFSARMGTPLGGTGFGVVASGDVTLDDTHLPRLRTPDEARLLGLPVGWRGDNRLLAHVKLARVTGKDGPRLEVVFDRRVERPYDPAWSLDGWSTPCADPESCLSGPAFSRTELPGSTRWKAADHLPTQDTRRLATLISWSRTTRARRVGGALAWLRQEERSGPGGHDDASRVTPEHQPEYGLTDWPLSDPFHVYAGEWPRVRSSRGDRLFARADVVLDRTDRPIRGASWHAGLGGTYDAVRLRELDGFQFGRGLDSLRAYEAFAPGGFAYAGGRFVHGDMVARLDLRAELFTPGPQAGLQSLPGGGRARVTLLPRFGLAFPISDRDAVSLSYQRIEQNPARDFLYDNRRRVFARQPLGNPDLEPAGVISYQATLKHLFGERTYVQTAAFYRDLFSQVGARDFSAPGAEGVRRYASADNGSVTGFEVSLLREDGERSRLEAHYTFMHARGTQSLEEGDPYGVFRGERPQPLSAAPLHWDRRHTIALALSRRERGGWSWSWTTRVGSGLPWTPRDRRAFDPSLARVNSRRFPWSEWTDVAVRWTPTWLGQKLELGLDARNLFDERIDARAAVDGYPNPAINTVYDDYGAYRAETGQGGGAYWNDADDNGVPGWISVGDARLVLPGRSVRFRMGARW
jgi:outer membrane receptor protein involved in Fe transport